LALTYDADALQLEFPAGLVEYSFQAIVASDVRAVKVLIGGGTAWMRDGQTLLI
jgi:hypothetical protein